MKTNYNAVAFYREDKTTKTIPVLFAYEYKPGMTCPTPWPEWACGWDVAKMFENGEQIGREPWMALTEDA